MSLNKKAAANIMRSYESIESNLVDFISVVPPVGKNMKVWSPKLVNIILDSCGLIDSIFRSNLSVSGKKVKVKDLNFDDFRRYYEKKFKFSERKSIIFISPMKKYLVPFKDWAKQKNPEWWKNYNKIKHDRLKNIELATLQNALNSVCALFEIISQLPKLNKTILRYGWLNNHGYNSNFLPKLLTSLSRGGAGETFIIETKLFATTRGGAKFFGNPEKISTIYYIGGEKFHTFILNF